MNPLIVDGLWETMKKAVNNQDLNAVLDIAALLQPSPPKETVQELPEADTSYTYASTPQDKSVLTKITYTRRTLDEVKLVRNRLRELLLNTIFPEYAREQQLSHFTSRDGLMHQFKKRGITISNVDYNLIPPILRTDFQEMGIIKCITTKTLQFTPEYLKTLTGNTEESETEDVVLQVCLLYEQVLLPNLLESNNYYKVYSTDVISDCFDRSHPSLGDFPIEDHVEEILFYLQTKNLVRYEGKDFFNVTDKACKGNKVPDIEGGPSIYVTVEDVQHMLQATNSWGGSN